MPSYYLVPFAAKAASQTKPGTRGVPQTEFIARPVSSGTLDDRDLAEAIARKCSLTESDVLATLTALRTEIVDGLANGKRINLNGLAEFYPKFRGTYASMDEPRSPARHSVRAGARPAQALSKAVAAHPASWHRVPRPGHGPSPHAVVDHRSGEPVDILTPGRLAKLTGESLAFDPDRADEGIFLVPVSPDGMDDALAPIVRIATTCGIGPRAIWFVVPDAPPVGAYRLEVRRRVRRSPELVTGRLEAVLQVDPAATPLATANPMA